MWSTTEEQGALAEQSAGLPTVWAHLAVGANCALFCFINVQVVAYEKSWYYYGQRQ